MYGPLKPKKWLGVQMFGLKFCAEISLHAFGVGCMDVYGCLKARKSLFLYK